METGVPIHPRDTNPHRVDLPTRIRDVVVDVGGLLPAGLRVVVGTEGVEGEDCVRVLRGSGVGGARGEGGGVGLWCV